MTPTELLALEERVKRANYVKTRLAEAETLLQTFQGSLACEQYEVVAERLTRDAAAGAPCYSLSAYTRSKEVSACWYDTPMPPDVKAYAVLAMRALVRHLRAEYEVC